MISIRLPLFLLLISLTTGLTAQQFGGNPPSLRWRQINTDTARIIFPAGLERQAEQIAAIVHHLSVTTLPTVGSSQRKINIVLQNQTIIPNGYVGLAPFRSEFQLTPEQNSFDLGSLPWQKMLAIHEYRHVQQYNNYRVGLSRAAYYLFGEGGQALANSLAVPNWFWEGDAVYQETLVSDQGRGRLPYFFNGYRSLWAAGKNYSWMKLRNGSLRDYVPDHYPLGFMLVAYGREKYGDEFWKKVSLDAAAFKGPFYPLQRAVKKYAGISFTQFRRDALDYFRTPTAMAAPNSPKYPHHSEQEDGPTAYARHSKHFVANEEFPQLLGNDRILYMRSSYRRIPAFVVRDLQNGTEKIIRTRSISLDNYFSRKGQSIVYAAYETDPRWSWRDYSVIRVLDLSTGQDRRITARSRYFAPDISFDGSRIVAVQEATDGSCELHILNSGTGAVEQIIPNKDSLFYTYPKFYPGGNIVSAVRNKKGEMSLALVKETDGSVVYLTPYSYNVIGFPSVDQDTIWFTASHNDHDQVFAAAGGRLFKASFPGGQPLTGQYGFQAAQGKSSWSTFTAAGFILDTASLLNTQLTPLSAAQWDTPLPTHGIHSLEKGPAHLLDQVEAAAYPVTKYPADYHLLNFHSWRPYITDPDYTFSLVSENVLNTLQSEIYVDYNRNEKYKQVGVDATYGALFPWITAGWDYIFDRNYLARNGNRIYWDQMDGKIGFSIPLNFTRHLSFTNLQFGSDFVYNQQYFKGVYKDSLGTSHFAYLNSYINFSHQSQQARQQIYPRLAQSLYLNYKRAITDFFANQFLASAYLYLPGIAFTHNLVLGGAFQQRDKFNMAGFSNGFPFSRGYTANNFYSMYRFSANYHFPLAHPDWGLGNIVYFQRIRANGFYDYTQAQDFYTNGNIFKAPFRSYGTEIYFDTKWWNQLPISFGIRYSRLIDPDILGRGPNQWEFILPINLLSRY